MHSTEFNVADGVVFVAELVIEPRLDRDRLELSSPGQVRRSLAVELGLQRHDKFARIVELELQI